MESEPPAAHSCLPPSLPSPKGLLLLKTLEGLFMAVPRHLPPPQVPEAEIPKLSGPHQP